MKQLLAKHGINGTETDANDGRRLRWAKAILSRS